MDHVRDLGPKTSPNDPKIFSFRRYFSPKNYRVVIFLAFTWLFNGQTKQLVAISPLFAMVGLAFALAGVTAAHHLYSNPSVMVDKKKRASEEPVELKHPDEARRRGQMFAEESPMYKMAKGTKTGRAISEAQHLPTILPGDESSADHSGGTSVDIGGRGGSVS